MITLDATIVNVALGPIVVRPRRQPAGRPVDRQRLHARVRGVSCRAGALADRVGARAGFLIGLADLRGRQRALQRWRTRSADADRRRGSIQGARRRLADAVLAGADRTQLPRAAARRRALAIWGGASGVGLAGGPVVGGVLTSAIELARDLPGQPARRRRRRGTARPTRRPRPAATAIHSIRRRADAGGRESGPAHRRFHRRR